MTLPTLTIRARYRSTCRRCGKTIAKGDLMLWCRASKRGYCLACAPDIPTETAIRDPGEDMADRWMEQQGGSI